LHDLSPRQAAEAIQTAVEKQIPLTVTVPRDDTWASLRSRFVAVQDGRLLIEHPAEENASAPHEFAPADKLSVMFKLKHHKHVFSATVAGTARHALADGTLVPVLAVVLPSRMQRVQRRVYVRADVPANRIVRASAWLGGCSAEPAGTTPQMPVWSGTVANLSAGGAQLRLPAQVAVGLEPGDIVGIRIVFGAGEHALFVDAQFRHAEPDGDCVLIGLQFVGLLQNAAGRSAFQVISRKVSEFQAINAASQRRMEKVAAPVAADGPAVDDAD
jgi:c-di-GMP-binding flagellar brake protein YcgR